MKSGRIGVAVDAARADLAHQVHAHRVAAEREERAVAEREDAAIAPHQVERQRQQRVAEILAEQRDTRSAVERASIGGTSRLSAAARARRSRSDQRQQDATSCAAASACDARPRDHASTARPLSANRPRGRFWMNRMMRTSTRILPSTAPA